MTTLAADANRTYEVGGVQEYPMIASDIIYEGAAVGLVAATGLARPLTSADHFVGFAERQVDNATGAASAKNIRVRRSGQVQLTLTGALVTDFWQPVYAADDNAFQFSPVGGVFVGFVSRFVSSGVVIVAYDVDNFVDPYAAWTVREAISADKTLDVQDNGKLFWVDTDAKTITLPATATPVNCLIVNGGGFGTIAVALSPNASDKVQGPDIGGTDDHDLINTKATANRGDFARLTAGDANGPIVSSLKGIWATA